MKSFVWRLFGLASLGVITWLYTKDAKVATIVTLSFHLIRIILYYFHEQMWNRIDWGLKNKSELTEKEKKQIEERLRKLGYVD